MEDVRTVSPATMAHSHSTHYIIYINVCVLCLFVCKLFEVCVVIYHSASLQLRRFIYASYNYTVQNALRFYLVILVGR